MTFIQTLILSKVKKLPTKNTINCAELNQLGPLSENLKTGPMVLFHRDPGIKYGQK